MIFVLTSAHAEENMMERLKALAVGGMKSILVSTGGADSASADTGVTVIDAQGLKRGGALKRAFEAVPDGECVMTFEEDRVPSDEEIAGLISAWESDESSLAVCCYKRRLSPVRRLLRRMTGRFLSVTTDVKLSDVFSGFRIYPKELVKTVASIPGTGSDLESAVLVQAAKSGVRVIEAKLNSNADTPADFSAFSASLPIYRVLLAFILSSLSSFAIDYAAFLGFSALLRTLPGVYETGGRELLPAFGTSFDIHVVALVLARCISSFCNFMFNRRLVFKAGGRSSVIRYYALLIVMLLLNSGLFTLITGERGLPAWVAQPLVQVLLYPLNFYLQRRWVFRESAAKKV